MACAYSQPACLLSCMDEEEPGASGIRFSRRTRATPSGSINAAEVLLKCDGDRTVGELSYFNADRTLNSDNLRDIGPGKFLTRALNQLLCCGVTFAQDAAIR
jgi:hypothetical protein